MIAAPALSLAVIARLALFAALGAGIGLVHFTGLRRNVDLLLAAASPWRAVGVMLLRAGITGAGLFACALAGAGPLGAAMAGLLAGRAWVLRKSELA